MSATSALRELWTGEVAPGEVELLRANEYALLGRLLANAPDAAFLRAIGDLRGDDTPLGRAHSALAEASRHADPKVLEREYFSLFIGVGRGELLPYASFYLSGFLNDRPLAAVRRDMAALGLERVDTLRDPEDHLAILFDVMAGLASRRFDETVMSQDVFFARHIEPWASKFFDDLAIAPSSDFYRHVAALGGAFIAVETEAFAIEDN